MRQRAPPWQCWYRLRSRGCSCLDPAPTGAVTSPAYRPPPTSRTHAMRKPNRIRELLAEGKTVTGIILFTGSPMVVELMAAAGVDFVIIDMEHSALDLDQAAHLMRAADAAGITPFVRVPGVDAGLIMKLLDLGAAGLVLPHANREN